MRYQLTDDNELILTPLEGPTLIVQTYDQDSGWFSIEFLDVMFEVQIENGGVKLVRVPDDSDYNVAAALIAEDYQDLIFAGCTQFRNITSS